MLTRKVENLEAVESESDDSFDGETGTATEETEKTEVNCHLTGIWTWKTVLIKENFFYLKYFECIIVKLSIVPLVQNEG